MLCKDCENYAGGYCRELECCPFPVSSDDECLIEKAIDAAEREDCLDVKMPFPGMRWEDINSRHLDETGAYFEMKDGSVLHTANGIDWVAITPEAFERNI